MQPANQRSIQVESLPAFADNYIWLLRDADSSRKDCAVVDPGDAGPVLDYVLAHGLQLRDILLTHHHADHAGGVAELLARFPARVHGPADARLGDWCQPQRGGQLLRLPELELGFEVLDVPAHTCSHIAFHGHGLLFSGDTLFSIGCGRLFEGTADDMQRALDLLATLAPDTLVYCGHEYTLANCSFALSVDPHNATLHERANEVADLRRRGRPSLPARLGDELAANPFLRTRTEAVVAAAQQREPAALPGATTLAVIRAWKDRF